MKDYGREKAWSKIFSFDMHPYTTRHLGTIQPIQYLNDGGLLMFQSYSTDLGHTYPQGAFVYMDPKRNLFRYLKIHGMESKPEVISHTPSFVSLKHALKGKNLKVHNVKVHNVTPRYAKLKPRKEANDITVIEEEF